MNGAASTIRERHFGITGFIFEAFYLQREFRNIIICVAYVPPRGNAAKAASSTSDCVNKILKSTPTASILILEDFNHCKLELSLSGYEQYIK